MGIAPAARLAVYKVCWGEQGDCDASDIAAAMEKAVQDGVDIISISIGFPAEYPFYTDHTALAAFGAIEKGVFVSASAGNSGPFPSFLSNTAPWMTTVGASSMDREFLSFLSLGNGQHFKGLSLYRGPGTQNLPLLYDYCSDGGLDPHIFKGKLVLCTSQTGNSTEKSEASEEGRRSRIDHCEQRQFDHRSAIFAGYDGEFYSGGKDKSICQQHGCAHGHDQSHGVDLRGKKDGSYCAHVFFKRSEPQFSGSS